MWLYCTLHLYILCNKLYTHFIVQSIVPRQGCMGPAMSVWVLLYRHIAVHFPLAVLEFVSYILCKCRHTCKYIAHHMMQEGSSW